MTAVSSPLQRPRVDALLVERGFASGRARAAELVRDGQMLVDGVAIRRPALRVDREAVIEVKAIPRFVGRGGEKLEGALERTGIQVAGRRCLDVGASTGGFTDCLLQRGAARVVAIDVAAGELAMSLRADPRVEVHERVNARDLPPLRPAADLAVVDVSFISATLVVPAVVRSLRPGGDLLVLAKPQFEVGRGRLARGGVVHDPVAQASAVAGVALAVMDAGLRVRGVVRSAISGGDGNLEFFVWGRLPAGPRR